MPLAPVQQHFARCGTEADHRARDQNFSPEPFRLLQGTTGKFVAGDTAGKSQVVLDSRGCPGLPPGRLALDNDRSQPFRCAVDRGRKTCRSTAYNRHIVFARAGTGLQTQVICNVADLRPDQHLTVGEPKHGAIALLRAWSGPKRRQFLRIRRQPSEGDLIARQKPAQVAAGAVPAIADQCHTRLGRLVSNALETANALARQSADLEREIIRDCRDRVVLLDIHAHHARRFRSAIPAREWGAQGNGHLAKNGAGEAPAEPAFDPVDGLDHLDLAAEDSEERALSPLRDGELSLTEVEVGGGPGQPLQLRSR